jgi:hypothetical protein
MKITICGSMTFSKEMQETYEKLKELGHKAYLPNGVARYISGDLNKESGAGSERKIQDDLIRAHYNLIKDSDAILFLNYDKNGIKNYVGGNSLMEIGFAHVLNKNIYLMNDIPDMNYKAEIIAMKPIIIKGNLNLLNEK